MAINFPDSPTNGQSATLGGNTWTYNSTSGAWARASSAGGSSITTYDSTTDLPLSGVSAGDQAFVTGSNRMYVSNGTGWYSVSLVNTNPSITSVQDSDGGSTPFTLATDGTGTVITVTAADPEGIPLTYGYSVTSGSLTNGGGTTATVAQGTDSDVNKFTITPSSTEAYAGTFELTFTASDGINQGTSANSFTLEFITIVANSKYTTLLAAAVDTSDNNNITEASSNNHTITVNGDAHAGTFSPYRSGGYSTYFDGAGDYIDTGLNNVPTDFTFECWVNTTVGGMLMARYASGSALDGFIIDSTSGFPVIQINTNSNNLIGTVNLKDGKWHHLAFIRDSNVCKIFVDGVLDVSQTDSEAMQVNANWIIGRHGNNASYYYGGYIRDLRWVAGTVRYTSNFTPPTEPLTTLSGDNLFTCHLPYIVDGSSTPYTMTSYGNVSTKPFSPYDRSPYSAADHGGSLYFDGNGDAIEIADNDDFDFGTGDLTIECWVYPEVTGNNYPGFLGTTAGWGSVAASGMRFDNLGDSKFQMSWYGPGDPFLETQSTYLHDQWYHFVVTRTGGNTWRMFINGILEDVATNSTPYDICVGGHNLQVGGKTWDGGNGWFKGNVADLRLTKGSVVTEYQTSSTTTGTQIFTPRTTPITSSGSELHIKGTDASIIDKSQGTNLKLVGTTTGSTTQVKFAGTKSIYSDGTAGNHISIPSDDSIFSKDYTIEFWMYPIRPSTLLMPFSKGVGLQFYHQSGNIAAAMSSSNSGSYFYNGNFGSITTNAWSHISLVRDSSASTYKFYINGTLEDTLSSSANINAGSADWIIAAYSTAGSYAFEGYLQDVRVTEGLTRYTANFTPPTASLEG